MGSAFVWWREYKDYQPDTSLKQEKLESGKGLVGCEMHDRQGWGLTLHHYRSRDGRIARFFASLLGISLKPDEE